MQDANLKKALDSIEEYANKIGYGMFEASLFDSDIKGEIHLIPANQMGMPQYPHSGIKQCECNPKLMREDPIKIYLHNRI